MDSRNTFYPWGKMRKGDSVKMTKPEDRDGRKERMGGKTTKFNILKCVHVICLHGFSQLEYTQCSIIGLIEQHI